MLLQGAVHQSDEMIVQQIGEAKQPLSRQIVIGRNHDHKPINGKGPQSQPLGPAGVRQDADLGEARENASCNVAALPFLEFDIDLGMGRHPR